MQLQTPANTIRLQGHVSFTSGFLPSPGQLFSCDRRHKFPHVPSFLNAVKYLVRFSASLLRMPKRERSGDGAVHLSCRSGVGRSGVEIEHQPDNSRSPVKDYAHGDGDFPHQNCPNNHRTCSVSREGDFFFSNPSHELRRLFFFHSR